jgi:succinate-semialdehyde dehydrogenase/glutarate-semialdehyde dehydrogenase
MLISLNPATEVEIGRYAPLATEAIATRIDAAHRAFLDWRGTSFDKRAAHLSRLAEVLRREKESHAELITAEMGKTLKEACDEIEKCATTCDYYAANGEAFLRDESIATDPPRSFVTFQPIGLVLAVMPWNFPFWQVIRFAAPAMMSGNGAVLKHASNVSGCALALEQIFLKAGLPEHLFTTVLTGSREVAGMIAHPAVRAVTLTGSTQAGRKVAAAAGEHLKKSVMELGGSDAYVVLRDADLKKTVEICANARLINAGQSCIAAKRFIVEAPLYNAFVEAMTEHFRTIVMGDPRDAATRIGPMARTDLRDELHAQVTRSITQGARLTIGGVRPERTGAFYPATILADMTPGITGFDEETFGPVAAIARAKDEADAIALANGSPFGLGAAVFTEDSERGEHIARNLLEAGSAFVNFPVRSDPRLPFGGVKDSGYGRELSAFGIREFVNIKSVRVA